MSSAQPPKPRMPSGNRGEVWIVDVGMAAKVRPCLVLSVSASDADRARATLVPHTTSRGEWQTFVVTLGGILGVPA